MIRRLSVHVEGQVQGVGFRYSTAAKARALGLSGWVRNLKDGRVEAVFEGDAERLGQMLAWCRHGPSGAVVRDIQAEWSEGEGGPGGFQIRF